ncbi:MAG: dihydroorotate dehydrogenase electron transfer subunit, partial [Clostridia bacterium]|nr:dihydroorotate dehydrogenase electron transfer subunit [Clostridia bacterium]
MKKEKLTILSNTPLTKDVFKMVLQRNTITAYDDIRCGQFVNVLIDSLYLRRPISVCDYEDKKLTLLYKVVGQGTQKMSYMSKGKELDVLTGLGNGYNTQINCKNPLLIGGGVGVPPLYMLCKQLVAQAKQPTVILGFNT